MATKKTTTKAASKPATKKTNVKLTTPKKTVETKKVEEEKKTLARDGSVYHLAKNSDGKWEIKLAKIGGAAGKVIGTYSTKEEAQARVKELKANTGRKALAHKSKGANKGKVHKI